MQLLRLLYGRRRDVVLLESALGPVEGQAEMLVYDREPTVSTVSATWAGRMQRERPGLRRGDLEPLGDRGPHHPRCVSDPLW